MKEVEVLQHVAIVTPNTVMHGGAATAVASGAAVASDGVWSWMGGNSLQLGVVAASIGIFISLVGLWLNVRSNQRKELREIQYQKQMLALRKKEADARK